MLFSSWIAQKGILTILDWKSNNDHIKIKPSLRNDKIWCRKNKSEIEPFYEKRRNIRKKQRISKVPIHLREIIQKLLDLLKKYDIIAPVNKEQLSTGNTFTNPVLKLRKGESLKIVFDARYLNSMMDESKWNWPIESVDVALTRTNGTIFTTADLISAYNQIPLDEQSMR